jgi:3',5'-cyclic AMP phosphodiesterase CpdA
MLFPGIIIPSVHSTAPFHGPTDQSTLHIMQSNSIFLFPALLLCWFLIVPAEEAIAQQFASGYVYEDIGDIGYRSDGDPGIAGVMVSNQRDVVLTDENGYYRIPVEEEMIIFVSKPAEYSYVVDGENIPVFYYIHQPAGSPELEYPGLDPTGALPESIDFGLVRTGKKVNFRAIIFGDPQPRDHRELSFYRDGMVSELTGIDADFTMVLGDIMYDDLSLFSRYNALMATLGMPVYNVIGNHDLNFDTDGNRYARETFKQYYGPSYYSFEEGDVHFLVLDNINYLGLNEEGRPAYNGNISNRQMEWIANTLNHIDPEKLVVLAAHIPLFTPGLEDVAVLKTANRDELIPLLEDFDRVLFLACHMHTNYHSFMGEEFGRKNPNPIHQIMTAAGSGSWWGGPKNKNGVPAATQRDGSPNGYHIFEFTGNEYTERYKAAGLDPEYQMRIESPATEFSPDDDTPEIRVNVFNGSERSAVKFRLNGGEWKQMERLEFAESSFFRLMREEYPDTFADWIQPIQTTHIWNAPFPRHPEPGVYLLEVRTTDMFGQTFRAEKVFEVFD